MAIGPALVAAILILACAFHISFHPDDTSSRQVRSSCVGGKTGVIPAPEKI
jgi:hypothetical protein